MGKQREFYPTVGTTSKANVLSDAGCDQLAVGALTIEVREIERMSVERSILIERTPLAVSVNVFGAVWVFREIIEDKKRFSLILHEFFISVAFVTSDNAEREAIGRRTANSTATFPMTKSMLPKPVKVPANFDRTSGATWPNQPNNIDRTSG
ncbi:hypothetical protein J3P71_30335 (plasmid) [Rhizobium leguminosarum]|uniref:hypothetical protein n=1 Tax=Rhizobium leguminosarum TaxID=384 RepID=UPI0014422CD8|nr:hypothetical protein [Rhizobium leguminosarum]MBY5835624.1 hypothetical protein [Rhizobium leguminosarum]QSZ11992.1 hypothetical protein J3P71_30335 [Rhizobium leguminosarum]